MTVKVKYYYFSNGSFNKTWKNKKGDSHRDDGPAYESSEGRRYWYKDGLKHREDGPAIVWEDNSYSYYLNDQRYSKEEYWEEIEKIKKRKEGKRERNDCKS